MYVRYDMYCQRIASFCCPRELFLGKTSIDMAVFRFNEGPLSLQSIARRLDHETSPLCGQVLWRKDKRHIQGSQYKATEAATKLRKRARRKRKGLQDKEGLIYAPGAESALPTRYNSLEYTLLPYSHHSQVYKRRLKAMNPGPS